jgi:hypothetical protein
MRKMPISSVSISQRGVMGIPKSNSELVFRGRLILKNIYLTYHFSTEKELKTGMQMPEDYFLAIIPFLEEEGLDAAHEYLSFSAAGIAIKGFEGGYSHYSREKLALLYIIINYELGRKLQINALIKDELIGIKSMADLVDWVSNYQNEKDMQRILEKDNLSTATARPHKSNPISPDDLLTRKELASKLNISTRTISRHPDKFVPILIGKRYHYSLQDSLRYKNVKL